MKRFLVQKRLKAGRLGLVSVFCACAALHALAAEVQKATRYTETLSYKSTFAEIEGSGARPSLAAAAGEWIVRPATLPVLEIVSPREGKPATMSNGLIRLTLSSGSFAGTVENLKTGASWSFNFAEAGEITGWKTDQVPNGLNVTGIHSKLGPCTFSVSTIGPNQLTINWKALKPWAGLQLVLRKNDQVFGGGERFLRSPQLNDLALNPKVLPMVPQDGYVGGVNKPVKGMSYCVTPWMFTPEGLGIFVDSFAVQDFTFNTPEQVDIHVYAISHKGNACTVHLLAGENPKELLNSYTGLTGRMPVAPEWAYGVWGNINNGRKNALETLALFRKADVPISAVWIFDCKEPHQVPHIGWWMWAKGVYGDVPSLNREIRASGCKPMTYLFAQNWNDGFHNAKALNDWEEWLRKLLVEDGWNGWMEDFGENNPQWPLEYHKASHLIASTYCPDKVTFCRSGYAGSQAFTQVLWAGDQEENWGADGYPSVVPAALSSGMSGFTTWAPDILESPSLELFQRWTSLGAFSCVMREHQWEFNRIHSTTDWRTLEHFRRYAKIHNSLVPYITSQVRHAAETGIPVMRHLLVEFPDDPKSRQTHDQYMFGDSLMVAPVLKEGTATRQVYFPAGAWYDFWTMTPIQGGQTITVNSPFDHIPVFVKAGAVLPLYPDTIQTLAADLGGGKWEAPGKRLILRIFPGGPGSIVLADGSRVSMEQRDRNCAVEVKSDRDRDWELQFSFPVVLDTLKITGGEIVEAPQSSKGASSLITVRAKSFTIAASRR